MSPETFYFKLLFVYMFKYLNYVGRWWLIGKVDAFRPKGHGFDTRTSRHVGTMGRSFIHSCQRRFCVKFRHSIRSVSGAPLSSGGLEEAL